MNQNVSKTIDKIIVHISQAKTKSKRECVCAPGRAASIGSEVASTHR